MMRNSIAKNTMKHTGATFFRKSTKVSPTALPIMIFGGSPISVAVPPMLDANICAIRYGVTSTFS